MIKNNTLLVINVKAEHAKAKALGSLKFDLFLASSIGSCIRLFMARGFRDVGDEIFFNEIDFPM